MTEPDRPPGGTHRRSSRAERLPVLVGSLIAVAVAAVAVIVVLNARGEPAHHPPAASSSLLPATSTGPASSGPASSGPASSSTASSSTAGSPSGPVTSAPLLTAPGTVAPVSPTAQTAGPNQDSNPAPSAPLDVLNDSRITGLAHHAADQLRAAGWQVATIGNFTGGRDVPETTIFFPDGAQAAAERLAARFGVDRVLPAPSFLSNSHLSVVLARDWDQSR